MMAANHPNDIELLEYVEGDLDEPARAAVHAHLEDCETCAAEIGRLELARGALRASPLLQLPAGRRAADPRKPAPAGAGAPRDASTLHAPSGACRARAGSGRGCSRGRDRLGERRRDGAERRAGEPLRAAGGSRAAGGGRTGTGAGGRARRAARRRRQAPEAAEDSGGGGEEPAATSPSGGTDVQTVRAPLSVGGTPEQVFERLAAAGLVARIVGKTVEVTGATEDEIAKLLEDLGSGSVSVTVVERPG